MAKGTVAVKFTGDVSALKRAIDDTDGRMKRLGGSFASFGKTAALGLAGVGVAGVALGKSFVDAAVESQKVTKQTEAVIKSMGGVANVTAQQVSKMSESLAMQTGVDDELIQAGQNVLLTFGNVRNAIGKGPKVFDRATEAALDMSVALGTDMTSASMMVGKALNDPVKGLAKLSRSGVQFSREQEDQIKTMVLFGKTGEAQAIMLEELERQFGGSAEAQATAGDKLRVVWGNLQEDMGERLLPVVEKVASFLSTNLPRAMDFLTSALRPVIAAGEQFFNIFARRDFVGGPFAEDSPIIDAAFKMRDAIVSFVHDALDALSLWWSQNGDNVLNFFKGVGSVLRDNVAPVLVSVATIMRDQVLPRLRDFAGWIGENESRMAIFRTAILGLATAWGVYSVAAGVAAAATLGPLAPILLLVGVVVALTVATQELADAFDSQLNTALQWVVDRSADILGFFSDLIDLATRALAAMQAVKEAMPGGGGGIGGWAVPGPLQPFIPRFDSGGVMPGPRGKHSLAWVAGGETVLPTHRSGGGGAQVIQLVVDGRVLAEAVANADAREARNRGVR